MRLRLQMLGLVAFAMALAGCATNPLPPDYKGPRATLADTATMETRFRAAYFYVTHVDGKMIDTNLMQFRRENAGRGMSGGAVYKNREVPARPTKLKLEARHVYGAPIQEIVMAMSMRSAEREIEVDLQPDVLYEVVGVLEEGKDDVWLQVRDTKTRVGTVLKGK